MKYADLQKLSEEKLNSLSEQVSTLLKLTQEIQDYRLKLQQSELKNAEVIKQLENLKEKYSIERDAMKLEFDEKRSSLESELANSLHDFKSIQAKYSEIEEKLQQEQDEKHEQVKVNAILTGKNEILEQQVNKLQSDLLKAEGRINAIKLDYETKLEEKMKEYADCNSSSELNMNIDKILATMEKFETSGLNEVNFKDLISCMNEHQLSIGNILENSKNLPEVFDLLQKLTDSLDGGKLNSEIKTIVDEALKMETVSPENVSKWISDICELKSLMESLNPDATDGKSKSVDEPAAGDHDKVAEKVCYFIRHKEYTMIYVFILVVEKGTRPDQEGKGGFEIQMARNICDGQGTLSPNQFLVERFF